MKKKWMSHVFITSLLLSSANVYGIGVIAQAQQVKTVSPTLTKSVFLLNLISGLGLRIQPTEKSPFLDVPTNSRQWPSVFTAISMNWMTPDSPHRFGVNDPVTANQAAQVIAVALNISLPPNTTAYQWLSKQGILDGTPPNDDLTVANEKNILSKIKVLKNIDYIPKTWKISARQAEELIQGMRILNNASWVQESGTLNIARIFKLTSKGSHNTQTKQEFEKLDQTENQVINLQRSPISSSNSVTYATQTITTYLNGKKAQSIQLFRDGLKIFANNGGGWQPLHQGVSLSALASQMNFQSSMIANVTSVPTRNGVNYIAKFTASLMPQISDSMIKEYASFSDLVLNTQQQDALQTYFQKNIQAKLYYTVNANNSYKTPLITQTKEQISVRIPSNLIPLTSESKRTEIEQMVKNVNFTYDVQQTASYQHQSVIPPQTLTSQLK